MLNGVGGVHEVVDADVAGGKDLFAGNVAVGVDSEALAADDDYARMSLKILNLFEEAVGERNVVSIHTSNKLAFGLGEAEIEGSGDLEVGFMAENMETGVDLGKMLENLV